jgi:hypothetical protein
VAIDANASNAVRAPIEYARLLTATHHLIREGKGDSTEAEALADHMDAPWYAMTRQEQLRMRGLAADLHALRQGGSPHVQATAQELSAWQSVAREVCSRAQAGDVDAALNFLRRPAPLGLPAHLVPDLQADCWELLGDLETAKVFRQEAERLEKDRTIRKSTGLNGFLSM